MLTLARNPECNSACRVCHYKDLEYPAQLTRKQRWAQECLGEWAEVLRPIISAPENERLGYREKTWLRANFQDGALSFGMYRAIRGETKWEKEFISWNTCPLHSQAIRETTRRLSSALAETCPKFCEKSLFGVWIGSPHLVVIAKDENKDELASLNWESILAPPLDRAWFHKTNQVGKSVFGEGPLYPLFGPPPEANHPVRAFRQIAQTLLKDARGQAVKGLLSGDPELVFDLYCGTGEIARLLPPEMGWIGIETSKEAVASANTLRTSFRVTHEAVLGLVEQRLRDPRVIEKIPGRYALYINPPRPGIGEEGRNLLLELFRERRPTSIVYLSCSASSLARDLRAFTGAGFELKSLQPYDFFPQTEHFETLAVLSPT